MDASKFQQIFDMLQDYLPTNWKRVIFYAGYTTGSYSMKYYIDTGDGQFIDCFSLVNTNKAKLIKLFMAIDKMLSKERGLLTGNDKWTVFTMIVDSFGNMKTNFDYADLTENTIDYERNWKEKYLVR